MTDDNLITQIQSMETKLELNKQRLRANQVLAKKQITHPIVMPLLLASSVMVGILLIRKKKHKHVFAYLTSLSLVASSVYKNMKMIVYTLNKFSEPKSNKQLPP